MRPSLRLALLVAGVVFATFAALMYEDEERKLRNRLVTWWSSVTDTGERKIAKHVLLTRALADQALKAINRLFDEGVLTLRGAESAFMVSMVGVCFVWSFVIGYVLYLDLQGAHQLDLRPLLIIDLGEVQLSPGLHILGVFGYATIAIRDARVLLAAKGPDEDKRTSILLTQSVTLALLAAPLARLTAPGVNPPAALPVEIILVSVACNLAFAALLRWLLTRAVAANRFGFAWLLLTAVVPVVGVGVAACLLGLGHALAKSHAGLLVIGLLSLPMSAVAIAVSLWLLLAVGLLALNALFWALASRTINLAYERLPVRKFLFTMSGVCFLAYATTLRDAILTLLH